MIKYLNDKWCLNIISTILNMIRFWYAEMVRCHKCGTQNNRKSSSGIRCQGDMSTRFWQNIVLCNCTGMNCVHSHYSTHYSTECPGIPHIHWMFSYAQWCSIIPQNRILNDTTVKVKTSKLVCKYLLITHVCINLTSDPHFLTATYMYYIKSSISWHTLNFMYIPVHWNECVLTCCFKMKHE
jgi:hypothetical protein